MPFNIGIGLGLTNTRALGPGVAALTALYADTSASLPTWLSPTRTTSATYINSTLGRSTAAINAPRFDYAGSVAPALLVEPAVQNFVIQSKYAATWSAVDVNTAFTASAAAAADGTTTAATVFAATTAGATHAAQLAGLTGWTAGQPATVSLDLKANDQAAGHIQVNFNGGAGLIAAAVAYFGLSGAGATLVGGDLAGTVAGKSSRIFALGNGIYRCEFTFTVPAGTTNTNLYNGSADANYATNGRAYVGVVGKGVNVSDVQVEVGSFATSPFPTTTTAATRAADVVAPSGQAATYLSSGGSYIFERIATAPGSSLTRVYGAGPLASLPTGFRYTKVAIYNRALSAGEQSTRVALGYDLSLDDPNLHPFSVGVNMNLFGGYGSAPATYGAEYRDVTQAEIDYLKARGVSKVRLPFAGSLCSRLWAALSMRVMSDRWSAA